MKDLYLWSNCLATVPASQKHPLMMLNWLFSVVGEAKGLQMFLRFSHVQTKHKVCYCFIKIRANAVVPYCLPTPIFFTTQVNLNSQPDIEQCLLKKRDEDGKIFSVTAIKNKFTVPHLVGDSSLIIIPNFISPVLCEELISEIDESNCVRVYQRKKAFFEGRQHGLLHKHGKPDFRMLLQEFLYNSRPCRTTICTICRPWYIKPKAYEHDLA